MPRVFLARRTRLGTRNMAGSIASEAERQLFLIEDFFANVIGQRHFGRGNEAVAMLANSFGGICRDIDKQFAGR